MENEIDYEQLSSKEKDTFDIIDVRDEESYAYGHITGAINIPANEIYEKIESFSKDKELYLYCRIGQISAEIADNLRDKGYKAYNLKDGYFGWLRNHVMDAMDNKVANDVENSIRKKFHKSLFTNFCKAIMEYDLIQPNDKIAVCISGGKDSMLMAKLFQELKRHNKFPFELVFLVMDPGYSKENREIIEKNAQMLNIPITVFETDIFENVFNIEKSPCYICARMRRGHLYNKAKELGCNKIALGHHYDDVIETILMGMLYGAQIQTMMPKLHSSNFEGMELIRPMYLIREADIKHWRDYNNLHFIQCACKFTDNCSSDTCKLNNTGSKRKKVKMLIEKLKNEDPQIESNIFRSVENVNLSTVIAYKDENGEKHNFKDTYFATSKK
jgi:tRNA(Ile)-lysidine synthase TilS/MesJ/rhodanese-related sulfurtransferase